MGITEFVRRFSSQPSVQIAMGMGIGQGTLYLSIPLLSRLYTPEEFGRLAVFTALASTVAAVATLRLEYFVAASNESLSLASQRAAIVVAALSAVVAGIGLPLALPDASGFRRLCLGVTVFSMGVIAVMVQVAARRSLFAGIAFGRGSFGLAQVGVQVGGGLAIGGAALLEAGLAAGYAANAFIQTVSLRRSRLRSTDGSLQRTAYSEIPWSKAGFLTVAGLANVLTTTSITYAMAWGFSEADVGHLSIAQRLVVAPVGLLVAAVGPVVVGQVAFRVRGASSVWGAIHPWLSRLLPFALLTSTVLLVMPRAWIEALLGLEYGASVPMLRALAPLVGSQMLFGVLGQVLAVAGHARAQLIWDIARLASVTVGGIIVILSGGTSIALAFVFSSVMAMFYGGYCFIIWFLDRKYRISA